MTTTNNLPPAIMSALIGQVAQGQLRPANLVSSISNGIPVGYKEWSAKMDKERPGYFKVTFYKDAQEVGGEEASSPVEAKLLVIDFLVSQAKKTP